MPEYSPPMYTMVRAAIKKTTLKVYLLQFVFAAAKEAEIKVLKTARGLILGTNS